MSEFNIIKTYFTTQTEHRADVRIGTGDDAAIVLPPPGHELAITTDTLIAGVHFPESTSAADIGFKSLAVNLSDLAAMGATPAWVTMALTLPNEDKTWLQAFSDGFYTLANRHNVQLIGGDLTRGALSITVQAIGFIPPHQAILRSQAKPGDLIYVTGTIGDAGLGLRFLQQHLSLKPEYQHAVLERLYRPEPRIATGEHLRTLASAAIDISDGLAADLGHILEQSQVGAILNIDQLPLSEALTHTLSPEAAIELALTGGDDYELCFTVPAQQQTKLHQQLSALACRFTCIGEITKKQVLDLNYKNGKKYHGNIFGYQHF